VLDGRLFAEYQRQEAPMTTLATLAQALGLSFASGINLYATMLVVGLVQRAGWVQQMPGMLGALSSWIVLTVVGILFVIEFVATLVPGVASAWETVHTLIRPPAAAVLAAATAWHSDVSVVLISALLGGGMALTTHATKLGIRYAIDTSPEPVTNGAANVAEVGVVAALAVYVWSHPFISLGLALALLIGLVLTVRMIWKALRTVFSGRWMPANGLLQEPRCSFNVRAIQVPDED
jgi:hypothetical protein